MKNLLLILAVFVPFISFAGDHNATSDTYQNGAYISIDPSVRIYNEDKTWTNNPSLTFGYLSTVTSDIQAQLNSKTNSVISGAALNLTNTADVFFGNGTGLTNVTAVGVTGYSLKTNNLVAVALVEQTNALGYVTNTYLTYTTNAFYYLGQ